MFAWIHHLLIAEAPVEPATLATAPAVSPAARRLQHAICEHITWTQGEDSVQQSRLPARVGNLAGCPLTQWIDGPGRALYGGTPLHRALREAHTLSHAPLATTPSLTRHLQRLFTRRDARRGQARENLHQLTCHVQAQLLAHPTPRLVRG